LRDPNFYNVISDMIDVLLEAADSNLSSLNNENKTVIQQFNNSITQSLAMVFNNNNNNNNNNKLSLFLIYSVLLNFNYYYYYN